MKKEELMRKAIELSIENVANGGGPFGAVIAKDGEIIATGVNRVTSQCDPTAHAEVSLLSPEYLLSFERCPFHTETPDHYALVSYLIDLSVSQSSALMPLHSKAGYQSAGGHL